MQDMRGVEVSGPPVIGDSSLCAGEGAQLQGFGVALNGSLKVSLGVELVSLSFERICSPKDGN